MSLFSFVPLVGNIIDAALQGKQNKKNREFATDEREKQNQWNLDMYNRDNQYKHQLWDEQNQYNQSLWNQQNQYNSPAAQMGRFKEAGLNPNLIYGQSNMGGSVSTANLESSNAPKSEQAKWQGQAAKTGIQDGLMSMMAIKESAARTDNLEEQNKLLQQEQAIKAEQAIGLGLDNQRKSFDYNLESELRPTSVQARTEAARQYQINNQVTLNRDQREAASNAMSLKEAAQRIKLMEKQSLTIDQQLELNELDLRLKRIGIQPGDAMWTRILAQWINANNDNSPTNDVKLGEWRIIGPKKD